MKLASYVAGGKACYGAVVGDGVVTLRGHACLRDALAAGALDDMRKVSSSKPDHKLSDIRFLPAIPNPHKILCAGVNYKSHAAEVGRELPKQPSMFIRFTDTLVGHEGEMIRPKLSDNFDFEGELTMVIGKRRPPHPDRARARPCRRLHHLCRRQRARLPEVLSHVGQELAGHRPARPLDRHGG
jgi:2-keto-4-pentenoate hydratase/2-oxohepta-3-ene-1,7-dioic acid hydratase in catechol pathway